MSEISEIIKDLNLPKQILDKSEVVLKTLFGESFEEFGGMIADQVKLRRFNNQLKIFEKAQNILREKNIDPKKVSLKVLAPLIEYSSYEEEENLQDKWSNLTTHILEDNEDVLFQQNCISILNRISTEEAKLIDKFHLNLELKRQEKYQKAIESYERMKKYTKEPTPPKDPTTYSLDSLPFYISKVSKEFNIEKTKLEFQISNLVSLGLLKWETDVDVSATKSSTDPEDDDIDVDVNVYNNTDFIFTPLGDKFVRTCNDR